MPNACFRLPPLLTAALLLSGAIHLGFLFRFPLDSGYSAPQNALRAELRPGVAPLNADGVKNVPEIGKNLEKSLMPESPRKRTLNAEKPPAPEKKPTPKNRPNRQNPPPPMPAMSIPAPDTGESTPGEAVSSTQEAIEWPDDRSGDSRSAGNFLSTPSAPPRLPPRGRIRYRVDLGDREFEAGQGISEWTVTNGNYRLKMEIETVGLAWLVKPYHLLLESQGLLLPEGLAPERFSVQRNGEDRGERAAFDWYSMTLFLGAAQTPQAMEHGTQDLLSFAFHLGFMRHPVIGSRLPLTTGKKYAIHHLERLGDENIETPMGTLTTLHLRASGVNLTEIWLAYDYSLLPVKLRFVDSKERSFILTALEIREKKEERVKNEEKTEWELATP